MTTTADDAADPVPGQIDDAYVTFDNDQANWDADIWGYSGGEADVVLGGANAAVALGNTASGTVPEGISAQMNTTQQLDGRVESQADMYVGESGPVTASSTTYGNSFTAENLDADLGVDSDQSIAQGGFITSRALLEAGTYAESATATASAGANTLSGVSESGYLTMDAAQYNGAETAAEARIDAPDADVLAATGTAVAVLNNADGYTYGDAYLYGDQTNDGDGRATADIAVGGTYAAVGTAAITGNNLNLFNEGGVGAMDAIQVNNGEMRAESTVDLNQFPGVAQSSAAAIGNSASSSTVGGPQATVNFDQINTGGVYADALMTGNGGQQGYSTASAYGNSALASLCDCEGELNARNVQVNSGDVKSRSYNYVNNANVLVGSTVSVGNTATFQIGSPGE